MDLNITLQGSVQVLIVLISIAYISYMIGLIRVLKRLDRLTWKAFVPILNYYAQVRAIGAPARWFFLSLIPYVGAVYAGTIAIRLGAIFGKGVSFSLFWLTIGAFAGMPMISRSETIDEELLNQPIKLLDVRGIRRRLRQKSKDKEAE